MTRYRAVTKVQNSTDITIHVVNLVHAIADRLYPDSRIKWGPVLTKAEGTVMGDNTTLDLRHMTPDAFRYLRTQIQTRRRQVNRALTAQTPSDPQVEEDLISAINRELTLGADELAHTFKGMSSLRLAHRHEILSRADTEGLSFAKGALITYAAVLGREMKKRNLS